MLVAFKKPDKGVIVLTLHERFGTTPDKVPYTESKGFKHYADLGYPHFIVSPEDRLEAFSGLESRRQIYHEGNKLKKDLEWSVRLMPDQLIKRKLLNRIKKEMSEEAAKPEGNLQKFIKLMDQMNQTQEKKAGILNEDCFWCEKALEGLDARVAKGEADKPEVRKLLKKRIKELEKAAE